MVNHDRLALLVHRGAVYRSTGVCVCVCVCEAIWWHILHWIFAVSNRLSLIKITIFNYPSTLLKFVNHFLHSMCYTSTILHFLQLTTTKSWHIGLQTQSWGDRSPPDPVVVASVCIHSPGYYSHSDLVYCQNMGERWFVGIIMYKVECLVTSLLWTISLRRAYKYRHWSLKAQCYWCVDTGTDCMLLLMSDWVITACYFDGLCRNYATQYERFQRHSNSWFYV